MFGAGLEASNAEYEGVRGKRVEATILASLHYHS